MASFHPLAVSPMERSYTPRHRPEPGKQHHATDPLVVVSDLQGMQLGMYSQGSYRKRKIAKQNLLCPLPGTPSQTCIAGVAFMSWIFRCLWSCGVMRGRDMSIHVQGTLLRLPVSSDFAACHHHKLAVEFSWIEIMMQRSGWKPAWLEKNGPMKLKICGTASQALSENSTRLQSPQTRLDSWKSFSSTALLHFFLPVAFATCKPSFCQILSGYQVLIFIWVPFCLSRASTERCDWISN